MKRNREVCDECGTSYPCSVPDCGHIDCALERGDDIPSDKLTITVLCDVCGIEPATRESGYTRCTTCKAPWE